MATTSPRPGLACTPIIDSHPFRSRSSSRRNLCGNTISASVTTAFSPDASCLPMASKPTSQHFGSGISRGFRLSPCATLAGWTGEFLSRSALAKAATAGLRCSWTSPDESRPRTRASGVGITARLPARRRLGAPEHARPRPTSGQDDAGERRPLGRAQFWDDGGGTGMEARRTPHRRLSLRPFKGATHIDSEEGVRGQSIAVAIVRTHASEVPTQPGIARDGLGRVCKCCARHGPAGRDSPAKGPRCVAASLEQSEQ